MKSLAVIIVGLMLASCGMPVNVATSYTDPDTGASVSVGYSSKSGLTVEAQK